MSKASSVNRRRKQIALLGECYRHGQSAVPQLEQVVDGFDTFCHPAAARKRPVVSRGDVTGPAANEYLRGRSLSDLDQDGSSCAVHPHIENGAVQLDQRQFFQQGGEFGRNVIPLDVAGGVENSRGLVLRVGCSKVREEASTYSLGFSDVNDTAVGRDHSIDAGSILSEI
jgi:hypothetical protein